MAINELRGVTVHEIGELKEGTSAKGEWKLRPFVVEETTTGTNGTTYSDFLEITAWNKATEVLETLQVGDKVDIGYACSSRKQTTQTGTEYWRTGARIISLNVLEQATTPQDVPQAAVPNDPDSWKKTDDGGDDDDLPFS